MEQQSTWQSLFTGLVAILLLLVFAAIKKSKRSWPPGPTPWPVLGNIPQLGTLPHQSLANLAKKYGELMHIKMGSQNVLVASSPRMAEEFLKTQDKFWISRQTTRGAHILIYGGSDIVFSTGSRWRFQRKVFTTELFGPKRLMEFQKQRKEEILIGINDAIQGCSKGTKAFRMDQVVRKIVTNIISRMLISQRLIGEDHSYTVIKDTEAFRQTVQEVLTLFAAFYIGDFIPWMDRLDPQGMKKQMYYVADKFDKFAQKILDGHKAKLEAAKHHLQGSTEPQDVVDILLSRPTDADGNKNLTDDETKGLIQDVLVAGTETNTGTLEWALSEMLRNPRCLEKAQAEMDSVVGRDRLVEESDLASLPYLNAIVKENFRLHPLTPLGMPHISSEDCEVQGYRIPAGTMLFYNVYAIHRDPSVWDRPLEFYPERFLGITKDVHGLDFDLLPFGAGRRICPGKGQAVVTVQYTLAMLIQTCNWRLPGNMKPEEMDVEEVYGVTLPRRNPLQAIASLRVAEHVLRGCPK